MQTILITGCSSGIGYHGAVTLKAAGYRVFATARKPEDVTALTAQGFESVQLDLNSTASITAAVTHISQLTDGKIDVLFNNGAYGQPKFA